MAKVVVYPNGSVVIKSSNGFYHYVFDNLDAYMNSNQYNPSYPVINSSPYSLNTDGSGLVKTRTTDIAMKARPNFLFGADPEGFIRDSNGKAVAPVMIPGTKDKPHKVEGGAIQRDGMAAEFNVDPAPTFKEWNNNFEKVMKALEGFLPEGHTFCCDPSVEFDEEVFANAPDEYKELGCSPDWNAWDRDLNPPPHCEDRPYLRTAAGHIHIGWAKPGEDYSLDDAMHQQNCFDLVQQLDWYLGGWSLKHDSDVTRRELYGKAGACRLKPYGVEYRVLSNFWIKTPDMRKAVWNRMQMAIHAMESRFLPERAPEGFNTKLIEAINTGTMEAKFKKACRFPFHTTTASYATF